MPANLEKAIKLINERVDKLIKGAEKEIVKRYARTLAEIRRMLAELYEKYEVDGRLTYAELAKFNRLNKFLAEVNRLLASTYKDAHKAIADVVSDIYEEGYYLTAWAIETDTATKLAYSVVTAEVIEAMIENPVSGLTLSQTMQKNRGEIVYRIRQEVTQGLVKGETYSTMAKRLKAAVGFDAVKATRVVRTEGHRVQESAKHDAALHADKQGVRMLKEWNSLEDERVRPGKKKGSKKRRGIANHRMLNGKKIAIEEDFVGVLGRGPSPGNLHAAGEDINCRCFLTYEVVGVTKPQNGKELGFDEWKETRLKRY